MKKKNDHIDWKERKEEREQEDRHRVYPETRKEVLIIWSRRRSNFG